MAKYSNTDVKKAILARIDNGGRFTVSGSGVLQITASEILKSPNAERYISALGNIHVVKPGSEAATPKVLDK